MGSVHWKNLDHQASSYTGILEASVLQGDSKEQMRRNPLAAGPLLPPPPFLSPDPIWTLTASLDALEFPTLSA